LQKIIKKYFYKLTNFENKTDFLEDIKLSSHQDRQGRPGRFTEVRIRRAGDDLLEQFHIQLDSTIFRYFQS
jgi:hypothetical protein